MRRPVRWLSILVLTLTLVPGQHSTADAGVIPWLYDAVFGPVGHYGYGGYPYGGYAYGYPYAGAQVSYMTPAPRAAFRPTTCGPSGCGPAGCSSVPSYQVGYRPFFSSPAFCSTGACGVRCAVSGCSTCSVNASGSSSCQAKTAWKSQETRTEWNAEVIRGESAVPTPATADEAPRPKTFKKDTTGSSAGQPMAVEKVVADESATRPGDADEKKARPGDPDWATTAKPAVEASEVPAPEDAAVKVEAAVGEKAPAEPARDAAGFGEAVRGNEVTEDFSEPVPGVEAAVEGDAVPVKTKVLPDGLPETEKPVEGAPVKAAPELDINLPLDLENKTSWKFQLPIERAGFRAGFGHATVARTSLDVDVEYVVPSATALRLVSR